MFIQKPLRVASIFSGGFAGFEWVLKYAKIPHEVMFACEIDSFARKMYIANHDFKTFYKDVKEISGKEYNGSYRVDLLVGGFPCQSFSIAGKRGGLEDTRGTLFYEFARLIDEIKPKVFIGENVKGLLSHDKGRTWDTIQKTLRQIGYFVASSVLNARDFGTPQNRERIFIVGFKNIDDYYSFEFPKAQKLEKCLSDILEPNVDNKYFLSEKALNGFIAHKARCEKQNNRFTFKPKTKDDIANTITCGYGTRPTDAYLQQVGFIGKNSEGQRVYSHHGIATTLKALGGGLGTKTGLYIVPKNEEKSNIRKLTPRECARAMGDEKDLVNFASLSDTQKYKCIGNGIDINTMKALLEAIFTPTKNLFGGMK